MSEIKRCKWCNLKNTAYIKYHDEEWGVPNFDEQYLFEMLILESFQILTETTALFLNFQKDFCVIYRRPNFQFVANNVFIVLKLSDFIIVIVNNLFGIKVIKGFAESLTFI